MSAIDPGSSVVVRVLAFVPGLSEPLRFDGVVTPDEYIRLQKYAPGGQEPFVASDLSISPLPESAVLVVRRVTPPKPRPTQQRVRAIR